MVKLTAAFAAIAILLSIAVGANGEPYSSFDVDAGGNLSTYGPFHPVNL